MEIASWDFCPCSVFSTSLWSPARCSGMYRWNVELGQQHWCPETLAQNRTTGCLCWHLPLLSNGLTGTGITTGTSTDTGCQWCSRCANRSEPRVPGKRSCGFHHASFLYSAEICIVTCVTMTEPRGSWSKSRHPQAVSWLCPQPVLSCPSPLRPPPRLGDKVVWWGTKEKQDKWRQDKWRAR